MNPISDEISGGGSIVSDQEKEMWIMNTVF
jgi:hypothetical protein